jgi:hypothetical protein
MKIDSHKLSDRLSSIEEQGGAWRKRGRLVAEPTRCWRCSWTGCIGASYVIHPSAWKEAFSEVRAGLGRVASYSWWKASPRLGKGEERREVKGYATESKYLGEFARPDGPIVERGPRGFLTTGK